MQKAAALSMHVAAALGMHVDIYTCLYTHVYKAEQGLREDEMR